MICTKDKVSIYIYTLITLHIHPTSLPTCFFLCQMSRGEHDPGDASLKTPVRVNISRSLDLYHKYRLQRRNANPPGAHGDVGGTFSFLEVVPSGSSGNPF